MDIEQFSNHVKLKLEHKNMSATLVPVRPIEDEVCCNDLSNYLKEKGIVHGILEENVEKIVEDIEHWIEPVVVAEGTEPINGEPGFIKPYIVKENSLTDESIKFVDLRSLNTIQSVKKGEKIAKVIHHTEGTPGINVKGEKVDAKPGKPIRIKRSKNTTIDENTDLIYATADGQVSYQKRAVHVFPVYEVNGDLDLKEGNLTFVGNIHIFGDVPPGYTISAKGDIRIEGIVEASDIKAGGSIFIRDGIAGQGKAIIEAGYDIHTRYINQGTLKAAGDLHVNLISYSEVQVDGNIFCQESKGIIFGGTIGAGRNIFVNQAGTDLLTKTKVYLGTSPHLLEKQNHLSRHVSMEKENLEKVKMLKKTIEAKPEEKRSNQERLLLLKVRNTYDQTEQLLRGLEEELEDIQHDLTDIYDQTFVVKDVIYPGVETTFGKYKRVLPNEYKAVELKLVASEIVIDAL